MKIKLTKQQSFIIITITTLLLIIGLCFICRKSYKPISPKTVNYDNFQTYEQKLEHWKQQCEFQPGHHYNSEYIREKLGRNNRKVYCLNDKNITNKKISFQKFFGINYIFSDDNQNNELDYKYKTGFISDDWYFTRPGKEPSYIPSFNAFSKDILGLGTSVHLGNIKFNTYADTTPPPKPSDYGLLRKF